MIIRYGVTIMCLFIFILFSFNDVVGQKDVGKIKCVCLDAGHGGKDPGALGAKTYEKHIALGVVLKLGKLIKENYPDVKVIYIRSTDVFLELAERTRIANSNKADLFISVHTNAFTNKGIKGVETYVLGSNSSEHNLRVAMKENSVIRYEEDYSAKYAGFDPSRAESYIIFNLIKSMHIEHSIDIASAIQKELVKNTQQIDRDVRQGPLWVLKDVAMPSALVEIGYISNLEEERFMMTESGQEKIAKSIFRGFQTYKNKIEKGVVLQLDKDREEEQPEPEEREIAKKENEKKQIKPQPDAVVKVPDRKQEKIDAKVLERPLQNEIETQNAKKGLFYAVQIASATAKIKNPSSLCSGERVNELYTGGRYRYYVVSSENFDTVKKNLQKIKNKVHDCFIIAVHKGNIIPVAEARKLE